MQAVVRGGTIKIVTNVILARPDDLDRSMGIAGDQGSFDGVVLNKAAAEASTDEGDVDFDALAGHAQSLSDGLRGGAGNLCGRPELAFAVADMSGAIRRFHRSVRQEGDFVDRFELFGRAGMGLLEVPIAAQHGAFGGNQLHEFLAQACGGFLRVLDFVPLDFKCSASLHRGPGGIGEHGNAGAGIVAAAGAGLVAELMRQMRRLQFDDGADAGHFADFFGVGGSNGAAVDGAALHGGDEHSGNARVNAEARGTIYFLRRVGAESRFADDSKAGGIFQRRIGRRLKLCRGGEKLRIGEASGRAGMMDGTIFRTTFGMRDVPFDGGSGDEHFASGGAGFAQIFVGSSNAKAAAGELIAVLGIEVGLNDLHAAPIAAKFFRNEHGESGANTLAHFGLAAPDFCAAVRGKFEPGVGRKQSSCRRV